jgi:hypothetical protein
VIEASVTIKVAARSGKALTRKAASESPTRAGKLAAAKPPAHTSATGSTAHTSATESTAHTSAAHVATTEPAAHVSATAKPPAVSTPTTVSTPGSPAARERVSGQSPGESGSRRQNDHGLA